MLKKFVFLRSIQKFFKAEIYLIPHLETLLRDWLEADEALLKEKLGLSHSEDFKGIQRKEFEACKRNMDLGYNFTYWGHAHYPHQLYSLLDPPLTLMYKGRAHWLESHSLSIVGSREPHPLSIDWMKNELPLVFKQNKMNIVSGGARGVDSWAHRLALSANRKTLVFLPSGLNRIYPRELADVSSEWIQQGATFMSEYDSDLDMRKHLFQHRNRLIAAMGLGTLIVEAKNKSGSLMTAHMSLALGKPTWVLPGHPYMPAFRGSLDLLAEGAQCLWAPEDLSLYFNQEKEDHQHSSIYKKVKKSEKSL